MILDAIDKIIKTDSNNCRGGSSASPRWSHPSLLSVQWLTASMSGMVRQDLTQFFITCLLLIPCTSVDKKHRLSDRMRIRWRVLNPLNLSLKMIERNEKKGHILTLGKILSMRPSSSLMFWWLGRGVLSAPLVHICSIKIIKSQSKSAVLQSKSSNSELGMKKGPPTRSSNCSREMPEALSHPNWEHISLLFRKPKTTFSNVRKCLKLVILVMTRV